jgi:hypothetical protein
MSPSIVTGPVTVAANVSPGRTFAAENDSSRRTVNKVPAGKTLSCESGWKGKLEARFASVTAGGDVPPPSWPATESEWKGKICGLEDGAVAWTGPERTHPRLMLRQMLMLMLKTIARKKAAGANRGPEFLRNSDIPSIVTPFAAQRKWQVKYQTRPAESNPYDFHKD